VVTHRYGITIPHPHPMSSQGAALKLLAEKLKVLMALLAELKS
jgi:hypothetical protein